MNVSGTWSCRVDRRLLIHSSLAAGYGFVGALVLASLAAGCGSSDTEDDKLGARCDAAVDKSLDGLPD